MDKTTKEYRIAWARANAGRVVIVVPNDVAVSTGTTGTIIDFAYSEYFNVRDANDPQCGWLLAVEHFQFIDGKPAIEPNEQTVAIQVHVDEKMVRREIERRIPPDSRTFTVEQFAAFDALYRFAAGLRLDDQPQDVQREYLKLMRAVGPILNRERGGR